MKRRTPKGRVVEFRPIRGSNGDVYEFRYEGESAFAGRITLKDLLRLTEPYGEEIIERR